MLMIEKEALSSFSFSSHMALVLAKGAKSAALRQLNGWWRRKQKEALPPPRPKMCKGDA